jgi:DNA-binding Xre family transcriptional regulator
MIYLLKVISVRGLPGMNFQDLHEKLRLELLSRIAAGGLTGTKLAQQTGFRQAHISNFLNRRRALSLEGLDKVLAAQEMQVEDIISLNLSAEAERAPPVYAPPVDARPGISAQQASTAHLTAQPPAAEIVGGTEEIPVVPGSSAMDDARIHANGIVETISISSSLLAGHGARPAARVKDWQRFVAIRTDAQQAAAMEPVLATGSVAVIDRHYNSLVPYRSTQPNLCAVRCGAALLLRFVEFDDGHLILRPASVKWPTQLLRLRNEESPADYLVGRVCLLFQEL